MSTTYDTVIVGGGFYGLRIAQFLKEEYGQENILVIEKEDQVMSHASYNNQARAHNGYHYPRSILTALRSRVNLPIFASEYKEAIVDDFVNYYGIAKIFSKVSARQFLRFYERIDAEIMPEPEAMRYFDPKLIETIFRVKEYAFNAATLKRHLLAELKKRQVEIHTQEKVTKVENAGDNITAVTDKGAYRTKYVLNTTYSSINIVNRASGLPIIPLKHELAEMALVEVPEILKGKAFTIMCGPFFSLMPFPDKGIYTLSHVRYTPHSEWKDSDDDVRDAHAYMDEVGRVSHFPQMLADVKRYMPEAANITYTGESLWEVKTVLPQSEGDDSRPILYKAHHGGLQNYVCIMGGKIDNVYDVFRELRSTYAQNS